MILSLFEGESSNTQAHTETHIKGKQLQQQLRRLRQWQQKWCEKRTLTTTDAFVSKGPEKAVNVAAAVTTTEQRRVSYTYLSLCFASQRSPLFFNPLLLSVPSISFFISVHSSFFESRLLFFNLLPKKLVVLSCFMQSLFSPL